jgi:alkylhydroperoxidase/carboxymuconolactone decarboxylase family protein YurZ
MYSGIKTKTKFWEEAMFDEITDMRKTRKKYNQLMFRSGIGTFRKFEELEADALKDGALSRKYKELIALGISITQKCYG